MLNIIKASSVCALLGLGLLAGAPAKADALYIGAGDHGAGFGIVVRDHDWRDRDDWRRRDHDDWRWRDRWDYRPVRFCTAERALYKAERMGVRWARVDYENRAVIGVRGHDYRGRIQLTFGRAPNCPLIR